MITGAKQVKKVYLIFKTHLDLGFTDFTKNVVKRYFTEFIPHALEVAKELRASERSERFIWTTGSWLVYEYLEQASPGERKCMEDAILAGDIAWHGLPFTTHTELMDAPLFRYGLSLSQKLDRRFGKKTIAAKMTDVPAHTRSIVPLLMEAGIKFLHIGVNPASSAPAVPDIFVWRHTNGNEVVVLYHKNDYGLTTVHGDMDCAISFAHTEDNLGPQPLETVLRIYKSLYRRFPNAEIVASRLDNYAEELLRFRKELPVVRGELGDTWIHGVGTDPWKVSAFRALSRLRTRWLKEGRLKNDNIYYDTFSRSLLCIPEHTWGLSWRVLNDFERYEGHQFLTLRKTECAQKMEDSWAEQRLYITRAVTALGGSALAQEAKECLTALTPVRPPRTRFRKVSEPAVMFDTAYFQLQFDPRTGAISYLRDKATGQLWASSRNVLGLFQYEIFSQQDYDRFVKQYLTQLPKTASWAIRGFTKPGMDKSGKRTHRVWVSALSRIYMRQDETGHHFLLEMTMPGEAVRDHGCPAELILEVYLPVSKPTINFNLQWFRKKAYRMPEAAWLSFNPRITNIKGWTLNKMGERISPLNVVPKGNRKLHAVQSVTYADRRGCLYIEALDAALVAPGVPSLLNFNQRQPPLRKGIHFNLYNNVWNTNFPMWYEEDARFRFILKVR